MLGIVNTMFVLLTPARENYAHHWRDMVLPVTMGLARPFDDCRAWIWLRAAFTRALGIHFNHWQSYQD